MLMRIKRMLCFGLAAAIILTNVSVFADTMNIDEVVVLEKIKITGNIDFDELGIYSDIDEDKSPFYPVAVSLAVYNQDNKVVYREQKNLTVEEFEFEFDVPIAEDCQLKAVVSTAYGVVGEKEFAYTNAAIMAKLNSEYSGYTDTERITFIDNYYMKLGIDVELFDGLTDKTFVTDAVAAAIPYGNVKAFRKVFFQNVAVAMINEDKPSTVIKSYFDDFSDALDELGTAWKTATDGRSEDEKTQKVEALLAATEPYTVQTLIDTMKKMMVTEFVDSTEYYVDYAEIFTNEKNLYELTEEQLNTYNGFSAFKKDVALKELWNNKSSIASMATLQTAVTNALSVASKAVEDSGDDDDGGGGGGGGGFGGSGFTTPKPAETQEPIKPTQNAGVFSDVTAAAWYKTPVEELYKRGIVNGKGNGKFDPESRVTREEFAQMLYKLLGLEAQHTKIFEDVLAENWFYDAVSTLASCGVVNGKGAEFGVGENITRQDMAVMLNNVLTYLEVELQSKDEKTPSDIAFVEEYAKKSVTHLMSGGILNGYEDGTYGPDGYLTRAEAAQAVYSILDYVGV